MLHRIGDIDAPWRAPYHAEVAAMVFSITEAPLQSTLPLSPAGIARLQKSGLILPFRPAKTSKPRIDYEALQERYRKMLEDGPFETQTDLARHLGVSRVWVSRVLKGIRRKAD